MATQIMSVGTSGSTSGDVTISAGATLTVCLKDGSGPTIDNAAKVEIQLKDDAGEYFTVATLTGGRPSIVIVGAGTYRFVRVAGASCGVFSA